MNEAARQPLSLTTSTRQTDISGEASATCSTTINAAASGAHLGRRYAESQRTGRRLKSYSLDSLPVPLINEINERVRLSDGLAAIDIASCTTHDDCSHLTITFGQPH